MQARTRAFLVHAAITAAVLGALLLTLLPVWYPAHYYQILAAGKYVGLMAGLVFGLGPLLTLVVYRPGKRGLKFDLVVIALLQLVALGYGTFQLHLKRPLYMVFAVDRFNVLVHGDVDVRPLEGGPFEVPVFSGPLLVVATLPMDQAERERLIVETLMQGKPDIDRRPRYWSLYADDFPSVLAAARPLERLRQERPAAAADIDALIAHSGRPAEALVFHGVSGVRRDYAVALDRSDGSIVGAVATDPWLE